MQAAVHAIDANEPLYDLKTMEERVDASLTGRRFLVVLLSIFAGLALLLAAVGLYGVISYSVRMRTRELGIRMALGAQRTDILRMILGTGMQLAGVGLVLGLLATFTIGRVLSSLLYRVRPLNPLTLLVTAVLIDVHGSIRLLCAGAARGRSRTHAHFAGRLDCLAPLRGRNYDPTEKRRTQLQNRSRPDLGSAPHRPRHPAKASSSPSWGRRERGSRRC